MRLFEKRRKFSIEQVETILPLKTWWASLLVLPLSRRLILFLANRTEVTPNQVTWMALFLRFIVAGYFAWGGGSGLLLGAIIYYFVYTLDCVDGGIARMRGMTSEFGRYLDHVSDLVGDLLILAALAWSQGIVMTPMILAMVFMHIAECYINYLAGFAIKINSDHNSSKSVFRLFNRYRQWWFARNAKSFFSFPDYTAFVFVFCPLIGAPLMGIKVGFYFLLAIVLYTVFSTFVSIHTKINLFP
jgi:phosphatidylglycerophosphate synthase